MPGSLRSTTLPCATKVHVCCDLIFSGTWKWNRSAIQQSRLAPLGGQLKGLTLNAEV